MKMGKKNFKQEEIEQLKKNKYVGNISRASITYTDEFKAEYMKLRQCGKMPTEIFRQLGLNPEVVGQQRIDSVDKRLRRKSQAKESLNDQRRNHSGRHEKADLDIMSEKEQIKYLKQELEYYKQVNEFLKKNDAITEKYSTGSKMKKQ